MVCICNKKFNSLEKYLSLNPFHYFCTDVSQWGFFSAWMRGTYLQNWNSVRSRMPERRYFYFLWLSWLLLGFCFTVIFTKGMQYQNLTSGRSSESLLNIVFHSSTSALISLPSSVIMNKTTCFSSCMQLPLKLPYFS